MITENSKNDDTHNSSTAAAVSDDFYSDLKFWTEPEKSVQNGAGCRKNAFKISNFLEQCKGSVIKHLASRRSLEIFLGFFHFYQG